MGVEQPEHETITVNVETLGATAAELDSVRGLTDWAGNENIGLSYGGEAAFRPAGGLGAVHDKAMQTAWAVVQRIEKINGRYADGVAAAAHEYGARDRHSADGVDAAAKGMSAPPTGD